MLGLAMAALNELLGDEAGVRAGVRYTFLNTVTGTTAEIHSNVLARSVDGMNGASHPPPTTHTELTAQHNNADCKKARERRWRSTDLTAGS